MQVFVYKNPEEVAREASMIFAAEILMKPDCVIGLATGSTPIPVYKELIRLNEAGFINFSRVRSFNLDEYIGLTVDHPCSYRRFMQEQLFDHINIKYENTYVPDGMSANPEEYALEYDKMIEDAGGIDLQLLGIGRNGHIAFNEPSHEFVYPTNVVSLTKSTIEANKRFFHSADEVPRKAICMGIGSIMAAKRIVLLATGKEKAWAIARTVQGSIAPDMPASILRVHQNCQILVDEAAASMLQ